MTVTFNSTDATLDVLLSKDRSIASPHRADATAQLYSGVRANSSAFGGKVFFVVKLVSLPADESEGTQPECLVGVSTRSTAVSQLGSGSSWAYASSGQKWTGSKSEAFAASFTVGDQVACFLDLESEPAALSFSLNGEWLGPAFDLPQLEGSQSALFAHILFKGLQVEVDFANAASSWPQQASQYIPWTVWSRKACSHPKHPRSA